MVFSPDYMTYSRYVGDKSFKFCLLFTLKNKTTDLMLRRVDMTVQFNN